MCLGAFVPTIRYRYKNNKLIHPWRFTIQVRDHMDQNVIAMIMAELFALCVCVMCSSLCLLYKKDTWKKEEKQYINMEKNVHATVACVGNVWDFLILNWIKKSAVRFIFDFLSILFCADRLPFIRFVRIELIQIRIINRLSIEVFLEKRIFTRKKILDPYPFYENGPNFFDSMHFWAGIMINSIRFDSIGYDLFKRFLFPSGYLKQCNVVSFSRRVAQSRIYQKIMIVYQAEVCGIETGTWIQFSI